MGCKVRISSIYHSIQGEGFWTGSSAIFVRFQGCNLNCLFCDEVTDGKFFDLNDVMLLDIRMPKIDGLELCLKIRKIDDKVKICFLTASEIYDEKLKALLQELDQDVKCFISKPIELDDFVYRIRQELNQP